VVVGQQRFGPGPEISVGCPDAMVSTIRGARFLLPRHAYDDPGWYGRERRNVFGRSWALIGTIDTLVAAGDYVCGDVGGVPIVAVQGEDGELRAFQNLCRHRGMVMVDGCGSAPDGIRCFYHDWRYALDGSLRVVPQRKDQFPDLELNDWGLIPAAVAVWEGMVFAHVDPTASLEDALDALPGYIGSHQPGRLPLVASADLVAHCNWKLLIENHIDVYHLWYLHRTSLGELEHHKFEHHQLGKNWASYEPMRSADLTASRLARGTKTIEHLDDRDIHGVGAHLIFPNILLAANAEFFMSYSVVPTGPTDCRIEVRMRAERGADPEALLEASRSFIDEDIDACERIQQGLASPTFEVGPLAETHEAPITEFHQNLLAMLQ
jgi:phenylpropionate dioxygenase-like ring-hydroxylating dioxygenase large terminal subunit